MHRRMFPRTFSSCVRDTLSFAPHLIGSYQVTFFIPALFVIAGNMDAQIIIEEGRFIHLLPQEDGPLFCPLCPSRRYTDVTRVDDANRHIREQHPGHEISFQSRPKLPSKWLTGAHQPKPG